MTGARVAKKKGLDTKPRPFVLLLSQLCLNTRRNRSQVAYLCLTQVRLVQLVKLSGPIR
jgi:hypothetical protein